MIEQMEYVLLVRVMWSDWDWNLRSHALWASDHHIIYS